MFKDTRDAAKKYVWYVYHDLSLPLSLMQTLSLIFALPCSLYYHTVYIQSMAQPGEASENAAWAAIVPCVADMKSYYDMALSLERYVPELLTYLGNTEGSLQDSQAHAKLLADVFSFVLKFDNLKMNTPQIQNDFSYYRRMMGRHPDNQPVPDDLSYKMSMFLANATPMMHTLTTAVKKIGKTASGPKVADVLAAMANVCFSMVDTKKVVDADLVNYCQSSMVAAIVLYDHMHVLGAFTKKGPIPVKKCIQQLKSSQPEPVQLLNILRYSTAHLNDPDTPSGIQQLLA
eukprot:TRINITY_DN7638_c0_g2_i8.p1 TRINITY_DN7638_c0_g2~~TRINITY_DN7638_c0_g2_i8.p1  ORF type:complete len:288 (-),score=31.06 TRINITY_DN7638_c0_g2_i8:621-1484(-)